MQQQQQQQEKQSETSYEYDFTEVAPCPPTSTFSWPPPPEDDQNYAPTASPLYIPPPGTQHVQVKEKSNQKSVSFPFQIF